MAKIDVDTLKQILQRNQIDIRKVSEIIQDIETELEIQAAEKENRPPPVKKQFVILVSDPGQELKGKDYTGWVLQIPEEDSPYTAPERIVRAAYEYNATPKGSRLPLTALGEACEVLPARITKEEHVWIKTREPILVVTTDNNIPKPSAED